MKQDAPQRVHSLRAVFNALRYLVRAGCPWRLLPNDLPPWQIVHQQATRWLEAGIFEAMVHDLKMILRLIVDRPEQPTTAVLDARTMQGSVESGLRLGDGCRLVLQVARGVILAEPREGFERTDAKVKSSSSLMQWRLSSIGPSARA